MQTQDGKEEMHPAVAPSKPFEGSGKDIHLVNPPITSVAPMSGEPAKKDWGDDAKTINNAVDFVKSDNVGDPEYNFGDLEPGQGLFFPVKNGQRVDELLERMYRAVHAAKLKYSIIEHDEHGDEILDMTCVKERKRNTDGTIQLENGKPVTGANFTQQPKYTSFRNFVAKSVVKNDEIGEGEKASGDGVLVIRVL